MQYRMRWPGDAGETNKKFGGFSWRDLIGYDRDIHGIFYWYISEIAANLTVSYGGAIYDDRS